MKKFITSNKIKILIAILAVSSLLLPLVGNVVHAGTLEDLANVLNPISWISKVLAFVGVLLQRLAAIILAFIGLWFEWVLKITVAEMSKSLGSEGIGGSISAAWGTVRDIANLAFIFVLLYAAVTVIFQAQTKAIGGTIKNIIIIGLLMNFSMFFTKVIIDAGNIPAIGFYNVIITGAGTQPMPIMNNSGTINPGITTIFMRKAGVQSFLSTDILSFFKNDGEADRQIFFNSIFSAVAMVVMAIVFLVASVMFVARYILLVFLMILSPLALIAYILPGMQGRFWEWFNSLKNQVFFAPLFMLFIWVAIKVLSSTTLASNDIRWSTIAEKPQDAPGLILNYSLVIGFIVMALIASKKMASQSLGFSQVSGAIGTGVIGGAGIVGRNTIGKGANWVSETQRERLSKSALGRSVLWTANKTKSSSFDVRGLGETKLGKATGAGELFKGMGKVGGKGGFAKAVETKAEEKSKYAKAVYGQTVAETERAKKLEEEYKKEKAAEENRIRDERKTNLTTKTRIHEEDKAARDQYMDEKTRGQTSTLNTTKQNFDAKKQELDERLKAKREEHERIKTFGSSWDVTKSERELQSLEKEAQEELDREGASLVAAQQALEAEKQRIEREDADYQSLDQRAKGSKQEMDLATARAAKKEIDENEYSKKVIDKEKKWKDTKNAGERRMKEYANKVEKSSPVSMTTGTVLGGALGSVLGPVGGAIGAGVGAWAGNKLGSKIPYYWAGNKAAARKVRTAAEGKEKKGARKMLEDLAKEEGAKVKFDDEGGGDEEEKKAEGGKKT